MVLYYYVDNNNNFVNFSEAKHNNINWLCKNTEFIKVYKTLQFIRRAKFKKTWVPGKFTRSFSYFKLTKALKEIAHLHSKVNIRSIGLKKVHDQEVDWKRELSK